MRNLKCSVSCTKELPSQSYQHLPSFSVSIRLSCTRSCSDWSACFGAILYCLSGDTNHFAVRIAQQAEVLYSDARKRLQPDNAPLAKALGRPMAAHLTAKAALLGALTWRHQAAAAAADDQCGAQIACLQVWHCWSVPPSQWPQSCDTLVSPHHC